MPTIADPLAITPLAPPRFTDEDTDRLPRSHALVAFDHERGRAVQLLTTADARDLAASRLLSADGPSPRADLAEITTALRVWPATCSLHADLLYARLAPALIPDHLPTHRSTLASHLLTADPSEAHPRFRALTTTDPIPPTPLVGPFISRRRAERFADELIDLHDLCRKHELLVQAPNAVACVYKELGKCPAACDGSEPLDTYRARFAEALDLARAHPSHAIDTLTEQMTKSSTALDFESAERCKARIDRLTALRAPPDHLAADLRDAAWLAISKAADGASTYAALIRAGHIAAEHTTQRDTPAGDLAASLAPIDHPDAPDLLTIELLARRFARPAPRDPARLITLPDASPEAIERAINLANA